MLKIVSGTQMPIKGRGIARIQLLSGQDVRLGGVIYMLGLAENLLSLEALHLADYKLKGSSSSYELKKNSKIVTYRKREG